MAYLDDLKAKIQEYNPDCDFEKIEVAYNFAKEAHAGQFRHSGEEYITHPMAVAMLLTSIEADDSSIIAGLLHDVIEDTPHTKEEIAELFGEEVAMLTDGVTKLAKLKGHSKSEQRMENLRKMFFAMATDIRVIIIKLADRLHNMQTLHYHSSELKQREIARETLDIYTPLANRLGIFQFKWQMEDLCLRYLEPIAYEKLVREMAGNREKLSQYIESVISVLREKIEAAGIKDYTVYGRPKNLYSIHRKMVNQHKTLSEIYDILAVRVIVNTIGECYEVLGLVHNAWIPIPGRFKDYIAMPKQNMYQSIHTTIISPNGSPLEVQIRTREMHQVAEYGVAAHWRYKEGGPAQSADEKMNWLRQMLDWQKEVRDADEFMESVKNDLFDERVYVFTPQGDVSELPAGAVPLDFAYQIHTEVGHNAVGARVNGHIVTFDYQLKNGDIVEIITAKGGTPSRDWLNIVQTTQARNKIRAWFKKEARVESMEKGREIYDREIKKYGEAMNDYLKGDKLLGIAKRCNFISTDTFFVAIGDGHLNMSAVTGKIKDEIHYKEPEEQPKLKDFEEKPHGNGVMIVQGIDNVMFRLGRCCNPLPGDTVKGFITRGKGVTVHRGDCSALDELDPKRLIDIAWGKNASGKFQGELEVTANDRPRLTGDILTAISDTKTNINTVYGLSLKDGTAVVTLKIEVKNKAHLDYIIQKIRKIKGVTDVRRLFSTAKGDEEEDE